MSGFRGFIMRGNVVAPDVEVLTEIRDILKSQQKILAGVKKPEKK